MDDPVALPHLPPGARQKCREPRRLPRLVFGTLSLVHGQFARTTPPFSLRQGEANVFRKAFHAALEHLLRCIRFVRRVSSILSNLADRETRKSLCGPACMFFAPRPDG